MGTGKKDINSAKKEELIEINGIGNDMAEKIMTYRAQRGTIKNIDQLLEIPGFTPDLRDTVLKTFTA